MANRNGCNLFRTAIWSLMLLLLAVGNMGSIILSELPLVSAFFQLLSGQKHSPKGKSIFKDEYDYIVVGAGSAGSVVASRLSEVSCVNVLLLEAGGEPPILTEVPPLALAFWFTSVDWQFKTVPQKHTGIGLENRQFPLPAGKMLGGSSSLNNLLYIRGKKNDYNNWADGGATGWTYKDVLPYFLKLEDNKNVAFVTNGYHNTTGPMTFEQPVYQPKLKRVLRRTINKFGYDFVDSNAGRQTGFYDMQGNIRRGQRCGTAKAYLVPAENRENLDIVTNAVVKKILIDENKRAVGVELDFRNKTHRVRARREVIVSAGAVKTPQLLMLSGIGPEEELNIFNIPVVSDLPVGRNFHDQAAAIMPYLLSNVEPVWEKLLNPVNIVKYMIDKSGPYSSLTFLLFLAFLRVNSTSTPVDDPNYEIYLGEFTTAKPLSKLYGLKEEVYDAIFGPYDLKPQMLCLVTQVTPRCRGTITLNSTNVYDQPLIDPNYLCNPDDVQDLVDGMKVCERLATSRTMRKLGARPFSTIIPGCEDSVDDEDSYFRCQLKHVLISAHHLAGSVKMGDPKDSTTVVDPELRVKNVKGLRVVDASIMPEETSGNTNVPIIMIAEKASDMIRATINCNSKQENTGKKSKRISVSGLNAPDSDLSGVTVIPSDNPGFKDSLDLLQSLMDDLLQLDEVKEKEASILENLTNPMKLLSPRRKRSFKKLLKDLLSSPDNSAISAIQELLTFI